MGVITTAMKKIVARNVSFKLTPPQLKALDAASKRAGMHRAAGARAAFKLFAEQQGIDWPPDVNTWGGPREAEPSKDRRRKKTE